MYKTFIVLHIVGVTMMAGTALIDFVIYRQFWKSYLSDQHRGLTFERAANGLQRFIGIGMLLIILSGVGMMYYMHQVWGQQLWFRIKMGVLLIIIINGLGMRRMTGSKIHRVVTAVSSFDNSRLATLRSTMTSIQGLQLILFVVMFILSVFKFN